MISLSLTLLQGRFAVCRSDSPGSISVPNAECAFCSVTRTRDEVTWVLPEGQVRPGWLMEGGWRGLEVCGPLDFSQVGILASLVQPLSEAGVSVYCVSTFSTDYLFFREKDFDRVKKALLIAGHKLEIAGP